MTKYFCDESVIFMMDVEITRSENASWTELAEASIQSHVCLITNEPKCCVEVEFLY
jgi:hypothetical protein